MPVLLQGWVKDFDDPAKASTIALKLIDLGAQDVRLERWVVKRWSKKLQDDEFYAVYDVVLMAREGWAWWDDVRRIRSEACWWEV